MRAAIYCRLSYDVGNSFGLDVQEDNARAYCAHHNHDVVHVYRDEDADSTELDRPELSELRDAIHAGQFDVLVFPRLDRMARDQDLFGFLVAEALFNGVQVRFADPHEQFDDTPEGKLMRSIAAWKAEADRQRIVANTQGGRRKRAESGLPLTGRYCPYGYRWVDKQRSRAVEHPEHATWVRWLYERVADGVGLIELARELNARRVLPPSGNPAVQWHSDTIRRLLRNPIYIGRYEAYHVQTVRPHKRMGDGRMRRVKERHLRAPDDPTRVPLDGVFPALIDEGLFLRAKERFERNAREAKRRNGHPEDTLLRAGFVVCGGCGRTLTALRQSRRGKDGLLRLNYTCNNRKPRRGSSCQAPVAIHAPILDEQVWQLVVTALNTPQQGEYLFQRARAWTEQERRAEAGVARDLVAFERDLRQTEKRIADRKAELADEDDPDLRAVLRVQLKELLDHQRQLTAWREQARERAAHAAERTESFEKTLQWVNEQAERIQAGEVSYQEKRDILAGLDAMVVVWPVGHKPRWTLLFGWKGYLLERMDHPNAVPYPVTVAIVEEGAAIAPQTVPDEYALIGPNHAPYPEAWWAVPPPDSKDWDAWSQHQPATITPADAERLRADLAVAADWATGWLVRVKPVGRTAGGTK